MIRLFKKDKKKFINSRKIRNYLAYSIGEIILVVIGILIARNIQTNFLYRSFILPTNYTLDLELLKLNFLMALV